MQSFSTEITRASTHSGDTIFILGGGYQKSRLIYFKERKSFYFGVKAISHQKDYFSAKCTLKAGDTKKLALPLGKIFTTMIHASVNFLDIKHGYGRSQMKELHKLRFQMTAI